MGTGIFKELEAPDEFDEVEHEEDVVGNQLKVDVSGYVDGSVVADVGQMLEEAERNQAGSESDEDEGDEEV
jgi:hypothetical protein